MPKFVDETGNHYGRLTVLKRAERVHGKDSAYWHCRCDCGNETIVRSTCLRGGHTKSCGCLQEERRWEALALPEGVAAFNSMVSNIQHGAKARQLEWNLTDEQVAYLTKQQCYYCGAEPSQVSHPAKCNGVYVYNGLDRIDNDKGYMIDNVVPCCIKCNRAKRTMTLGEFESWIVRVYEQLMERTGK